MNISRNNKSHVDHDVTFGFKVSRESHAIGIANLATVEWLS